MGAQVLTCGNLEQACPGRLAWGRVRGQDIQQTETKRVDDQLVKQMRQ